MAEQIVFILELVGTAAFAVSGGLVAIEKRLDFLGITVLAVTTAVGGGALRDILLGSTPPAMFRNPVYVLVAAAVSAILLLMVLRHGNFMRDRRYAYMKNIMSFINLFDAAGLGVFTIVGMDTAIGKGFGDNAFLTIFVGVITGVGGGMLRDIIVCDTPLILRREIYATAAMAGAVLYYVMRTHWNNSAAMIVSILVIVAVRLTAICRDWHLPAPVSGRSAAK